MRPIPGQADTVVQARDVLAAELGRPPSLTEIGDRLGLSQSRVHQILTEAGEDTAVYRKWKMQADTATREIMVGPPKTAAQLLAANVRRLLEDQKMTEEAFAQALGLPGPKYVAVRNLRYAFLYAENPAWPKSARVDKMAEVLGVPRSELLREVEEWPAAEEGTEVV